MSLVLILIYSQVCQTNFVKYIPGSPYTSISSVFLESSQTLYYHSGIANDGSYLEGLFSFYYDTNVDTWRTDSQQAYNYPDSRGFYGSFYYNGGYYIFGGIGPNGVYNDMWCYNIQYQQWTEVQIPNPILPRSSFAYTSFTYQDKFYFAVLGGKSSQTNIELFDFYLYDVAGNSWIQQANYTNCCNFTLSRGQIQYYEGSIYLFAGASSYEDQLLYYEGLCTYDLSNSGTSSNWELLSVNSSLVSTSNGGGCIYENFIYYFFGFYIEDGNLSSSPNAFRIDLQNQDAGWENITIQPCEGYAGRNSFGYSCINSQFYVFGGYSNTGAMNSALNYTLSDGLSITCEIIFEQKLEPGRRQGASMTYISGGLYLFGGENKGVLLNDFWFFNITTAFWNQISAIGVNPSPRRGHAAASQGNYMAVVGGLTYNDIILGDYYLYDTIIQVWAELKPASGSAIPPPIAYTCLMMDIPKLYYVGGLTQSQLTLSLWVFDFSDLSFTELYSYIPGEGTPLAKHKCSLYEDDSSKYIYTFFGSQTLIDKPFCGIQSFNLSANLIQPEIIFNVTKMPCRTDSAFAILNNDYIIFAGGQEFQQEVMDDVWIINYNNFSETHLENLGYPIYSCASSFINNTLYIFSGFSNNGVSINADSTDLLQLIKFNETTTEYIAIGSCGIGMESIHGKCEFCGQGTYNDGSNNQECISCSPGTVNSYLGATDSSQCLPCGYGTYSTDPSISCQLCNASDVCYIGTSSSPVDPKYQKWISSYVGSNSQPPLYKPPDTTKEKGVLFIIAGSLVFVYLIVYFLSYNFRIVLSYYDLFKNIHFEVHSTVDGEFIPKESIYQPSKFGGFCTVITIIAMLTLSCNTMIDFAYTNVIEQVVMVPVGSLIQEYQFGSQEFTIDLIFSSYRGNCSEEFLSITNSSNILLNNGPIATNGPLCMYSVTFFTQTIIGTGDLVNFTFSESSSFTSDVIVKLSVDSSVPGYKSAVAQQVISSKGKAFRGSTPTIFYYSVLPAYYEETPSVGDTFSNKGYHISQSQNISPGSQYSTGGIPLVSNLMISVVFVRSDIGITTYKFPQVDFFTFFWKLMSDLPGTIVFIGFAMWIIEYARHLFSGTTSGRFRLAKRQIEEEKLKRLEKNDDRLLEKGTLQAARRTNQSVN